MASEPQSANDYDDRTTNAVKRVLVEIGQILGSYRDKFALIGGAVPWLLLDNEEMRHVGTQDIDLGLDAEALGDGEYVTLVKALLSHGYEQREELKEFQLVRRIDPEDGGGSIDVIVDFLMPREAEIVKNKPPLIKGFAAQKAHGAGLALLFNEMMEIEAKMPGGGRNRVEIAVATVPCLLAMKGYALRGRLKQKDAYDVYYCIRNYPGGIDALAIACELILQNEEGAEGFRIIAAKFDGYDGHGPVSVRRFVEGSLILGDRTPEQWQQDAFGQVDELVRRLKLR